MNNKFNPKAIKAQELGVPFQNDDGTYKSALEWLQNENGSFSTLCVVDEDTGVNYVVVSRYNGMRGANSVAICPRYNADGTLYTGD